MPAVKEQDDDGVGSSGTATATLATKATTAGNTIVVCRFGSHGATAGTLDTPTDDESNTYELISDNNANVAWNNYCQIWIARNISGGTSNNQITVTSGSTHGFGIYVSEWSGVSPYPAQLVESDIGSQGWGTSVASGGHVVSDQYDNLFISCLRLNNSRTITGAASYTEEFNSGPDYNYVHSYSAGNQETASYTFSTAAAYATTVLLRVENENVPLLIDYATGGGTPNYLTTVTIDSTDADAIITGAAYYDEADLLNCTDSQSNTYTELTNAANSLYHQQLYYTLAPTNNAALAVSFRKSTTFAATYPAGFAAAYKYVDSFDKQATNGAASGTTLKPGSVTPANDNSLIITGLCTDGATATIDTAFSLLGEVAYSASVNMGSHSAGLVLETAAATDPTWTQAASGPFSAAIAVFAPPGGAVDYPVAAVDGIDLSDSSQTWTGQQAVASDGIELSDSTTEVTSKLSEAVDGVTLSDSVQALSSLLAEATDSISLTDTSLSFAGFLTASIDSIITSDTVTPTTAIESIATDGVVFSESTTETKTVLSECVDGIIVTDVCVSSTAGTVFSVDGINTTDSSTTSLGLIGLSVDSIIVSDISTESTAKLAEAIDSVILVDSTSSIASLFAEAVDGIEVSDSVQSFENISRTVSDGIIVSDSSELISVILAILTGQILDVQDIEPEIKGNTITGSITDITSMELENDP